LFLALMRLVQLGLILFKAILGTKKDSLHDRLRLPT
jgi:hypothetical protein